MGRSGASQAMAAVRQALKDAGLGFGYGAIHAAIEGCVALGDIEAAIDVCVDIMGGGRSSSTKKSEPLGAKPTTFHALCGHSPWREMGQPL